MMTIHILRITDAKVQKNHVTDKEKLIFPLPHPAYELFIVILVFTSKTGKGTNPTSNNY
jgi:hypothetical protein